MSIKEIIQQLRVTMDDAKGQDSHFDSWLTQNEGICEAIDALKILDAQPPPLPVQEPQQWAVFCAGCHKEWSVPYQHPGKSVCADCEAKLKAQSEQEDAFEGWVKIDELREHFNAVHCGTIYKHGGEGRVLLRAAPPKREWVGLTGLEQKALMAMTSRDAVFETESKLKEKNHG